MRAGTPTLKQCQWLKRKFCGQGARTKIDTIHQLRSWASNRHIPTEHNMLRDGTMYVVYLFVTKTIQTPTGWFLSAR